MRLLALLLLAAPLAAQPIEWQNVGGPPGGLLPVLHTTEAGTVLAVDEIGRVGRSTDEGETWTTLDLTSVNGFSNAGGEVLAAADSGVFRSTDDGATWSLLADGPEPLHSVARADDTTLVATGGGRTATGYVSRDAGGTWRSTGLTKSGVFRAADGQTYGSAFLREESFRSVNRLLRWNARAARWDSLAGPDEGGVLMDDVTGINAGAGGTLLVATAGSGLLGCSFGGLNVRFPDGRWAVYNEGVSGGCYGPNPSDVQATSLAARSGEVLVGRYGQFDRYVQQPDGSLTFDRAYDTPGEAPVAALASVSGSVIASTGTAYPYAVYEGWGPFVSVGSFRVERSSGAVSGVPFAPLLALAFARGQGATAAFTDWGIWSLANDCFGASCGSAWTHTVATSPHVYLPIASLARTPWGEWLASGPSLYASAMYRFDAERGWEHAASSAADHADAVVAYGDSLILFAGPDGMQRSTDRGRTFERVSDRGFYDLEPEFTWERVFAGGEDGLYASSDSGATWTRIVDTAELGPVRSVAYGRGFARLAKNGHSATPIPVLTLLAGHTVLRGVSSTVVREGEGWRLPDSVALENARLVDGLSVCVVTQDELWCPGRGSDAMRQVYKAPSGASHLRLAAAGVTPFGSNETRAVVATRGGLLMSVQPILVDAVDPLQPEANTLRIAPNPASGRALVTLPPGTLRADVFDLTGRRVASLDASGAQAEWDAGAHAPGLYLVRTVTPTGVASQTVVVAR